MSYFSMYSCPLIGLSLLIKFLILTQLIFYLPDFILISKFLSFAPATERKKTHIIHDFKHLTFRNLFRCFESIVQTIFPAVDADCQNSRSKNKNKTWSKNIPTFTFLFLFFLHLQSPKTVSNWHPGFSSSNRMLWWQILLLVLTFSDTIHS